MVSRNPVRPLRYTDELKSLILPDEIVIHNNYQNTITKNDTNKYHFLELGIFSENTEPIKVSYAEYTDRLLKGRTVSLSGVTAKSAIFDGTKDIDIEIKKVPVELLEGIIDISNIPKSALERLYPVNDDNARFQLTTNEVQKGDTVKVKSTGFMYLVIDDTKLNSPDGYEVYNAGRAGAVPWSGVENKPISNDIDDTSTTNIPTSKVVNDLYKYTQTSITDLNDSFTTQITDLTNKVDTDISNLTNKVNTDISKLETTIANLSSNTNTYVNELKSSLDDLKNDFSNLEKKLNDEFLPLAGGTMTGNIEMSNKKITGLNSGSSNTDAANIGDIVKKVEEYITTYLNKTY